MTASDARKVYKQLKVKPAKLAKFKKHNLPKKRSCGAGLNKCKRCGKKSRGFSHQYGLDVCRQCLREIAKRIGFKKYS